MRRFRFAILALMMLINAICFGQKARWGSTEDSDMPSGLDVAKFQINDIKSRGIIVRLNSDQGRIKAYRRSGNKKVADELEQKAKGANLLLMYSFISQWSYCPVYFMDAQHTITLMQHDTLVCKTYDLMRDTSIYMNHDSFYVLDYGELMASDFDGNHPNNAAGESNTPVSGTYLVVKDHALKQLYRPMPYHSKIWSEGYPAYDKFVPMSTSASLNDSMKSYLTLYPTSAQLMKSDAKAFAMRYMDSLYDHVYVNLMGIGNSKDSSTFTGFFNGGSSAFYQVGASSTRTSSNTTANQLPAAASKTAINSYGVEGEAGATLQRGTKRLNTLFIGYYCIRLDKDRNIISRDDLLYWWQRNPNIQYLPYLPQLESRLKEYLGTQQKHTK